MEAWLQRQWQINSLWQLLLRPLSWLFAGLSALRRSAYRFGLLPSRKPRAFVIVIGNICVGGSGKTPIVLATVEALRSRGFVCGVITRGYVRGQPHSGVHEVQRAFAPNMSDEAVLLAQRASVPVFASTNRTEAADALLKAYPDTQVIVSDDGLQHYAMARDMEICVLGNAANVGNGARLPAGPLREPLSRLMSVNAVLHPPDFSPTDAGVVISTPCFATRLGNPVFVHVMSDKTLAVAAWQSQFSGKRVGAVAGIGQPQRFFDTLSTLGIALCATTPFPDHHPFTAADFVWPDVDIILMTQKDAVKCVAFADERMWTLQVDALLPDAFIAMLVHQIGLTKPGSNTR